LFLQFGPKCEDNSLPECKCADGATIYNFNPQTKTPLCKDGAFPRFECVNGVKFATECQDGKLPTCPGGVPRLCKDGSEPNMSIYPHCPATERLYDQFMDCTGGGPFVRKECSDGSQPEWIWFSNQVIYNETNCYIPY